MVNYNMKEKKSFWQWLLNWTNYGLIIFLVIPFFIFAIISMWNDEGVFMPMATLVIIIVVCIINGIKDYKYLTKNGYIKKISE